LVGSSGAPVIAVLPRVHRISWEPDQPCGPLGTEQRANAPAPSTRAWLVEHKWLRLEDINNPTLVADTIDRMLTDTEAAA
jgi:hypothetical protein